MGLVQRAREGQPGATPPPLSALTSQLTLHPLDLRLFHPQQIVLDILKAPLPQSPSSEAELDNLKKLHAEFNSCMNETRLNQLGDGALAPLLEDVKRLFPVDGYPTPRQTAGFLGDAGLGSDDVASAQSVVERIKAALAHAKQVAPGRTVDPGSQVLSERPIEDDVEELKGPHGGQYSKELTDTLAYLHSIGEFLLLALNLQ